MTAVTMLCHYPDSPNETGGVASHVIGLCEHLWQREDIALNVITFGNIRRLTSIGNGSLRVLRTSLLDRLLPPIALFRLARALKQTRPDVIHVQGTNVSPYSLLVGVLPHNSARIVVTAHTYYAMELVSEGRAKAGSLMYRLALAFERRITHRSDAVVAVSKHLAGWLVDGLGVASDRVHEIPNGTEIPVDSLTADKGRLRASLGLRETDFVILFAKQLVPKNGPHVLLEALALLLLEGMAFEAIIAGDGPLRETLEKRANQLGISQHVRFTGALPHAQTLEFIAACDVVTVPSVSCLSLQEATSILALEAMARARPIVASSIGGLEEVIEQGTTGILVPEQNPQALAGAIERIQREPLFAREIARNAQRVVAERYTWGHAADTLVQTYVEEGPRV